MNSKKSLDADIASHSIIGIGEGSHGTKEYQILRTKLVQDIYHKFGSTNSIIVFIEEGYFRLKFFNSLPKTKFKDFVKIIADADIYPFYKSIEFIILLYYLHKHQIPTFGMDIQNVPEDISPINLLEEYVVKQNKKILAEMNNKQFNNLRKISTKNIIKEISKKYPNPKIIILAHNYHVSGYENFPGLRIATYSEKGTVRVGNFVNGEFVGYTVEQFHYDYPVKKFTLVKTEPNDKRTFQNNSFVLSGEKYRFNKFDYIFMFPKTSAIKVLGNDE